MMDAPFHETYRNKKILITGHTGFKGSWLCLWLANLGAEVHGYALDPDTSPSLFELLKLKDVVDHEVGDVRDPGHLTETVKRTRPDIIFHMAAQSLVRKSYQVPQETIHVNALGTVHLMEAVRQSGLPAAIVVVTSDKCYENREWVHGYRETDRLGGNDPYSASKAVTEILVHSWRQSFFDPEFIAEHGVRVASVRAGNVVGGGDYSADRILPDCVRFLLANKSIQVRNPNSTRPWQHVLEPLSGYLSLGARLLDSHPGVRDFCTAFNFGPAASSNRSVKEVVEQVIECWGSGNWSTVQPDQVYPESSLLHLSVDKAYHLLNWRAKWDFAETISRTVDWYKLATEDPVMIPDFTRRQIKSFQEGHTSDGTMPIAAGNSKIETIVS